MRESTRLFAIAFLGYFLIAMVFFLLGGRDPIIQIAGLNNNIHSIIRFSVILLIVVLVNFALFMVAAFRQSLESKMEHSDEEGHEN